MRRREKSQSFSRMAALLTLLALAVVMYVSNMPQKTAVTGSPQLLPASRKEAAELRMEPVKVFPFSEKNALKEWEEKLFRNEVVYLIEQAQGLSYVRAKSDAAASAMYYKIKIDARTNRPVVTWKWKVEKFPAKKNPETLEAEEEHDFAARVYVIFPAGFILNSKVLEYIWAETLPVGSAGTSPYSKNIRLMVLESGQAKDGGWRAESRDILADYQKMFGAPPERDMGVVAFMTNTEHTGTTAEALYDDIRVGYKEDTGKERGKQ